MRLIKYLILFLSAHVYAANPSLGEHGMALFGGQAGLYASHLPMFHAPHDYQVVLQVHLADPKLDAALRKRLDGKTALWTISPEKFELDRLAPQAAHPLKDFKADLVLGHFEQGGKTQYAGVQMVVDQVLMYRQLDPSTRVGATARYVPVGRFLVKEIDSRPDFDHIVALRAPGAALTIPKRGLTQPAFPNALGTIYFYTNDLR